MSWTGLLHCGGGAEAPAPGAEQSASEPSLPAGTAGTAGAAGNTAEGNAPAGAGGASPDPSCASGESVALPCMNLEPTPAGGRCGDGLINREDEQCDGSALPANAALGSTCNADCTLQPANSARCGDGAVDPGEECDGAALPTSAPAGSQCSATCSLIAPDQVDCAACTEANCALQRAELDGDLPAAEPLIGCMLGAGSQPSARAAKESCANSELFSSCYCGASPVEQCVAAAASAASGPCSSEILAATGCDPAAADSFCPWRKVLDPSNTSGKVMQYVQCQQDSCRAQCFNP